jgi:hypothetical protein
MTAPRRHISGLTSCWYTPCHLSKEPSISHSALPHTYLQPHFKDKSLQTSHKFSYVADTIYGMWSFPPLESKLKLFFDLSPVFVNSFTLSALATLLGPNMYAVYINIPFTRAEQPFKDWQSFGLTRWVKNCTYDNADHVAEEVEPTELAWLFHAYCCKVPLTDLWNARESLLHSDLPILRWTSQECFGHYHIFPVFHMRWQNYKPHLSIVIYWFWYYCILANKISEWRLLILET